MPVVLAISVMPRALAMCSSAAANDHWLWVYRLLFNERRKFSSSTSPMATSALATWPRTSSPRYRLCWFCGQFPHLPPRHQSAPGAQRIVFSCVLIRHELPVEANFSADALFAYVDHDSRRDLGASTSVVLGCLKGFVDAHTEFGQGQRAKNF